MASPEKLRRKAERLYAHAGSWFWGPQRRQRFFARAVATEQRARLQERRQREAQRQDLGGWLW